ncbi:MAG: NeuD/PglB/VioB family sugar acetyltransferase [Phycisphaerales bacterium]|nr:NeuD/PglB/VioB family sugar acetyltransferase [Phycisphaerales bacterium]
MADLVLIGGGGHALVVADAALAAGHTIAGFLDDDPRAPLATGHPSASRLGGLADVAAIAGRRWIMALGAIPLRDRALGRLPRDGATSVVHPSAVVAASAPLGAGTFVAPGAVVHTRARVEPHAIINTGAIVEHECRIGHNAHVAPGAVLGGRSRVGAGTLVGLGARVLPNLSIGVGCTVGAGAVVVRDVPDGVTVAGVPARGR